MTKKYIARLDGKIVGKRKTENRTYTHAVVVQKDIERDRKRAYEYVAQGNDRSNFKFYTEVATQGVNHELYCVTSWRKEPDYAGIDRAKADIEGGFDGYIARRRDQEIERFEAAVKKGAYEPHAVTWCGRLDLAHKEVAKRENGKHAGWYNVKNIWIVDAEEVVK